MYAMYIICIYTYMCKYIYIYIYIYKHILRHLQAGPDLEHGVPLSSAGPLRPEPSGVRGEARSPQPPPLLSSPLLFSSLLFSSLLSSSLLFSSLLFSFFSSLSSLLSLSRSLRYSPLLSSSLLSLALDASLHMVSKQHILLFATDCATAVSRLASMPFSSLPRRPCDQARVPLRAAHRGAGATSSV